MKAIIPTGGRGTRMRPLTFSTNKHFIPVANKPLIFYPIETVAATGITEIAITYNPPNLEYVQSILGDGSRWGVNFTFVEQNEPKGLPNIFQVCESFVDGDRFLMHLGDNIFTDGIKYLVEYFEKEKMAGLVPMVHHKENSRLGVPYFDESGKLVKYVEKPANPPHDYAIPGLYFFDPIVFECFVGPDAIQPSARGEYEISDPYQWLLNHGHRVDVKEYTGTWLDPGKFGDWIESNAWVLDRTLQSSQKSSPDSESIIEGRVSIGNNCQIINSHIRGPVIIGDNVVINNAFIGPYTSVSNDCVIEGSDVENSVIMEGVRIFNIKRAIDSSLIGTKTEIIEHTGPSESLKLFVGEKCLVEI